GFASLLKSQAGGWKCDACLVSNPESTVKCLSCETVKPGEEANVAATASASAAAGGGSVAGQTTNGFASLLKSQAGGWKCGACLVSNPESTLKCLSCETVKPGEEANVAAAAAAAAAASAAAGGGSSFGGG
ncbi:unnamed protein product, partial [Laminaria digitata]